MSAKDWITRWCGRKVYERLWRPLFELKFYEYADNISAAWIWTRIKRVGTLAPLAVAGGARLHRGRLGDAGAGARRARSSARGGTMRLDAPVDAGRRSRTGA